MGTAANLENMGQFKWDNLKDNWNSSDLYKIDVILVVKKSHNAEKFNINDKQLRKLMTQDGTTILWLTAYEQSTAGDDLRNRWDL